MDVSGHFGDPEGDSLRYTATGLPAGLTIDPVTGVISGTVDGSASVDGPYTVTVTATDPEGASVATSFTWEITNPAPVAGDGTDSTREDGPVTGSVTGDVSDADGDTLTYTLLSEPSAGKLTFNADGSYSFDPAGDFEHLAVGETATVNFSYQVDDGEGGTDTAQVTITITGENDAPIVAKPLEPFKGHDNEVIEVDIAGHFADIDGSDRLSFEATGLPPGLTIDPVSGVISGKIDNLAYVKGPYTVVITVRDPHGGIVTTSVNFEVRPDPASQTREPAPGVELPAPESHDNDATDDIAVTGAVVDAVEAITDLRSTRTDLDADGAIVQAVNTVRTLASITGQDDLTILNQIRSLEELRQQSQAFSDRLDIDLGRGETETLRGYSLRVGISPSDVLDPNRIASELAFNTLTDDRTIIFEVLERQIDGGSATISGLSATLADGRPLPPWVRDLGKGTFMIEKPANMEALEVRIQAIMSDGSVVDTQLKIELENGEISAQKLSNDRSQAQPFATKLAEAAKAGEQEADELLKALNAAETAAE